MNRATAETQKEISEEEGLAPVLAWVKDLIDSVIAQEFGAPDLEFSFSAEASVDPQQQETILSSYTSKGILTINEARAALGREPLPEAAANKPMALTGQGYVALGQVAQAPSKSWVVSNRRALEKDGAWEEDQHPRWPAGSAKNAKLFDCQSLLHQMIARVLEKLGRSKDALAEMKSAPIDKEMGAFYGLAMDAKFFYYYLLAKDGDQSVVDKLSEIPDGYRHITMSGKFLTKADILSLLSKT